MATIHLMVGFIGFGKTTLAETMARELPAVCLTHDRYMVKLFGRNLPEAEFRIAYQKVDNMLWQLAEKIISYNYDVIMDYGFWNKEKRLEAHTKAKSLTENVVFHQINCDMQTAKQRVLKRSAENPQELNISATDFDILAKQYQPIASNEKYNIVYHDNN